MLRRISTSLRATSLGALLALGAISTPLAMGADAYDAAVHHPGRLASDIKRDALDHPAEMLRLAGLKPGMRVADLLAGDGYYSELASYVVGPKGHVLMLNDPSFEKWSEGGWQKHIANKRLPNVEYRKVDLNRMQLGDATLDAVLLVKVYHDLYWVDTGGDWPKVDVVSVLDQVAHALKPGGILLLIDHSAKAGTGSADASALHRIEEAFAVHDFERYGLHVIAKSDLLRNPEDTRDQISYKPPALGKTDRFVLVFRKDAE